MVDTVDMVQATPAMIPDMLSTPPVPRTTFESIQLLPATRDDLAAIEKILFPIGRENEDPEYVDGMIGNYDRGIPSLIGNRRLFRVIKNIDDPQHVIGIIFKEQDEFDDATMITYARNPDTLDQRTGKGRGEMDIALIKMCEEELVLSHIPDRTTRVAQRNSGEWQEHYKAYEQQFQKWPLRVYITPENTPSIRLATRCGFKKTEYSKKETLTRRFLHPDGIPLEKTVDEVYERYVLDLDTFDQAYDNQEAMTAATPLPDDLVLAA